LFETALFSNMMPSSNLLGSEGKLLLL